MVGDIIDWEEQKQAAKVGTHASVVAANVLSFVSGQPVKKVYGGSPEIIIVPVGKVAFRSFAAVLKYADCQTLQTIGQGYLGFLWGILVGDWFSRTMKGKTLMVPQARKSLGY